MRPLFSRHNSISKQSDRIISHFSTPVGYKNTFNTSQKEGTLYLYR